MEWSACQQAIKQNTNNNPDSKGILYIFTLLHSTLNATVRECKQNIGIIENMSYQWPWMCVFNLVSMKMY